MGGFSSERAVSLNSGSAVAAALDKAGYGVVTLDVRRDIKSLVAGLEAAKPDVVFNALHGRYGEDGSLQGLLDIMAIPYTHSGVLASAIAMNKPMARAIFSAHSLPIPDGKVIDKKDLSSENLYPYPYVLKPLNEGSSQGVKIIHEGNKPDSLLTPEQWPWGSQILIEKFIPGRELTVAVMGDRALGTLEITSHHGFYDYNAKYDAGGSLHLMPAPIPDDIYQESLAIALKAHQVLGCRGVSRSDMRYDDTNPNQKGKLYLLEINTQPGMTSTSLVPEIAAYAGLSFIDLVTWIVENASCDN
jgi:D-alanine-D-alanine ligase